MGYASTSRLPIRRAPHPRHGSCAGCSSEGATPRCDPSQAVVTAWVLVLMSACRPVVQFSAAGILLDRRICRGQCVYTHLDQQARSPNPVRRRVLGRMVGSSIDKSVRVAAVFGSSWFTWRGWRCMNVLLPIAAAPDRPGSLAADTHNHICSSSGKKGGESDQEGRNRYKTSEYQS